MGDVLKLAEKEIMRRELMMLCAAAAPAGCSPQVLKISVEKMGLDPEEIEKELFYLEQKGMLRKDHVENRRMGLERDIYSITAAGRDYLDGNGPEIIGIGVE
jgi:hypothetical protein